MTCVVKIAPWPLAAVLAAIPVVAFAAGPYLFQETFDDGSLDGAATVAGEWAVQSGALHGIGMGGRVDYVATTPIGVADYDVSATVRLTAGWASAGVITRFADRANYYYATLDSRAVGAGDPSRSLALYKVSPNPTEADSLLSGLLYEGAYYHLLAGVAFPAQLNQSYELSLGVSGDTLSVSVDGVVMFSAGDFDDALTVPGAAGLFSYQTDAVFDNWRVQARKGNRK